MALVPEELEDCVAGSADVETTIKEREQLRIIRAFLKEFSPTQRRVFLRRSSETLLCLFKRKRDIIK